MLNQLEKLSFSSLSQSEAGEIVQRLHDYLENTPPPVPDVDLTIFNRFIDELNPLMQLYSKSLKKVQANPLTKIMVVKDKKRDKKFHMFRKAVKVSADSDEPAEAQAAHTLLLLLNTYINTTKANYEAETKELDTFIAAIDSPLYASAVTTLGIQRYVSDIKTSSAEFKEVSDSRLSQEAQKEVYDSRLLRNQLLQKYQDLNLYVLVTASTTYNRFFVDILAHINTTRKLYADIIATRKGVLAAQKNVN